jgi:hypothetical protein
VRSRDSIDGRRGAALDSIVRRGKEPRANLRWPANNNSRAGRGRLVAAEDLVVVELAAPERPRELLFSQVASDGWGIEAVGRRR